MSIHSPLVDKYSNFVSGRLKEQATQLGFGLMSMVPQHLLFQLDMRKSAYLLFVMDFLPHVISCSIDLLLAKEGAQEHTKSIRKSEGGEESSAPWITSQSPQPRPLLGS